MQQISKNLEISGVYIITNSINGKRYIGSSNNIRKRLWKHRSLLRHDKHENPHLQNAWNKYGEDNFVYSILEECDVSILLEREQYYIDILKPEYNIDISTTHEHLNPETIEKMRKSRKEKMDKGEIKLSWKEIHQYDLNGNYIQSFKSIGDAAKSAGIHICSIDRFLNGKYKKGGNFLWSLEKVDRMEPYVKPKRKDSNKSKKQIHVFNDVEDYIFNGAKECAEYFKVHIVSVRGAICYNRNFMNKYKIEYVAQ